MPTMEQPYPGALIKYQVQPSGQVRYQAIPRWTRIDRSRHPLGAVPKAHAESAPSQAAVRVQ